MSDVSDPPGSDPSNLEGSVEECLIAALGKPVGSQEQINLQSALAACGGLKTDIQNRAKLRALTSIRQQLGRILRSAAFASSRGPRQVQSGGDVFTGLGRILSLVVESALNGNESTQYDLAEALYGKQDNEALQKVRVRMGTVRQKLSAYYGEGPGRADPIKITLPKGTYTPSFFPRLVDDRREKNPARLDIVTLTGNLGTEVFAALSPDGTTIAFSWNGADELHYSIYTKSIATNGLYRLTTAIGDDLSPTWSPDGRSIAFLRVSSARAEILIVPVEGGEERHVVDVYPVRWEILGRQVAWHPKEQALAIVDRSSPQQPFRINLHSLVDGSQTPLTSPPADIVGDSDPVFSNKGAALLAFIRTSQVGMKDVYVRTSPLEPATRVTTDATYISGLAWAGDSDEIVFSSSRTGFSCLWRTHIYGRQSPSLISGLPGEAVYPSVRGRRLAYTQLSMNTDIYRLNLRQDKQAPIALIRSMRHDVSPQISPDGRFIAFASDRDGGFEIWVCDHVGSSPRRLTEFRSPTGAGSPRWSPDSSRLVFDCRAEGNADLYVVPFQGGQCEKLTFGPGENVAPSWSKSGWIYFSSNRTGTWQVWRMRPRDKIQHCMTKQGGFAPFESPACDFVYYMKGRSEAGICRIPVTQGLEECVITAPPRGLWGYWTVGNHGLYFLDFERENVSLLNVSTVALKRLNWSDNAVSILRQVENLRITPYAGITISPDDAWMLFTHLEHSSGNIILKEHFD